MHLRYRRINVSVHIVYFSPIPRNGQILLVVLTERRMFPLCFGVVHTSELVTRYISYCIRKICFLLYIYIIYLFNILYAIHMKFGNEYLKCPFYHTDTSLSYPPYLLRSL